MYKIVIYIQTHTEKKLLKINFRICRNGILKRIFICNLYILKQNKNFISYIKIVHHSFYKVN